MGSPSSFRRKQLFISLKNSAFIENPSSSEGARALARANHAKKGCAERMRNAIEWNHPKCYCNILKTTEREIISKKIIAKKKVAPSRRSSLFTFL